MRLGLLLVATGLDPVVHQCPLSPMSGWVFILASRRNGTLYVGVTSDLIRRIHEHRESLTDGFTKTYNVKRLVYFEEHGTMPLAIQREKNIKHWPRRWKVDLIRGLNPEWNDLWPDIAGPEIAGSSPAMTKRTEQRTP